MKNIIKNIALLICVTMFFSSCETIDYGNTNDNPSGPTAPVTSQLLTSAQASIPSIAVDEKAILYMQHITQGQYPGSSRYETLTASYNGWYTGPMQNLNEIIKLNEDPATAAGALAFGSNENQIALAKILRAYYLQYMTDRWGYLPWTEAFKGVESPQPAFDSQESIYNFMFAEVDAALAMLDAGTASPQGDVLFGGDMDRWAAFGNNLKAQMAMRISDVNPTLAQSKFEQAVASGMLVTDNADNIEFNYGSDETSDSPWEDNFQTREDYILSVTMIEEQRANLDPRMFKYAEEARDSVHPSPNFPGGIDAGYVGAPNGAVNGNVPSYSFITSDIIYEKQYPSLLFSASETHFKMAEAAMKGWNVGGGTAAAHYALGIQASMDYWGVDTTEAAAYIAAHPYAGIAEIAYEKWVSLYLQGPEAWAEWRRLDLPALTPSPFASDPRIPVRDAYDAAIESNNKANYDTMVAAQGPDNLHTKLWWDVN
ncbi:SusD/RagB family nutrient-binding outer membrane lipoprotein [Flavobacteriaceae bacterium S0825]|uniref:SusD/RagB family nutrient-binding outer membrane lipoprotein n=1 Tax=Gaetbulibacter sp. S0825 TaxID=2720084 RepID=UPI0014304A43|nr:SusD/RagB family nutrient-binding outer membrane lipoprotein [Gaetbulibacter sp. S0825]MCK0108775.1 SusD/RagB family nutrient-binding outer membrane lipoprotein [Flavobacteriaceae bacterium S0825]NIX64411.1 SusD/RagB family nutrient-binding outer membrane lipoprotein [Gaetbulibacter sp. S0825]